MDNIKMVSSIKLECIVCRLKKDTMAELHRHQTFLHTTEELSLAAISHQVSAIHKENRPSSWIDNSLNGSEFYLLSAKLLDDTNNFAGFDRSVPLDYVVQKKGSLMKESRLPKAGLSVTHDEKNFIRRQQYRREGIFRALNEGVLDLSLPKKYRKSNSKWNNFIRTIFYHENKGTVTIPTSEKRKKSSKEVSGKRKQPNNLRPIKSEPIFMNDQHYEHELPAMPRSGVCSAAEMLNGQAITQKNDHDEELIDQKDNWQIDRDQDTKKTEYISPDVQSALIPLDMHKFLPKSKADYGIKTEDNGEPSGTNRKAMGHKKNRIPHKVTRKTSKKSKKSLKKDENSKTRRGAKYKKSEIDKNFNDNTCLDISEVPEENDDTSGVVREQVQIPEVGEEFFNDFSDSSDDRECSQLNDFEGVTGFPAYPEDMDDQSILVFDPESRGLVWTSFELVDDSGSPNNEDCSQNMQNDTEPETNETTLENNENHILFKFLTTTNPQQDKNDFFQRQPEKNKASLDSEETFTNMLVFQRSKRRRTMPDRYVPS